VTHMLETSLSENNDKTRSAQKRKRKANIQWRFRLEEGVTRGPPL
jgi:hypothetical protein